MRRARPQCRTPCTPRLPAARRAPRYVPQRRRGGSATARHAKASPSPHACWLERLRSEIRAARPVGSPCRATSQRSIGGVRRERVDHEPCRRRRPSQPVRGARSAASRHAGQRRRRARAGLGSTPALPGVGRSRATGLDSATDSAAVASRRRQGLWSTAPSRLGRLAAARAVLSPARARVRRQRVPVHQPAARASRLRRGGRPGRPGSRSRLVGFDSSLVTPSGAPRGGVSVNGRGNGRHCGRTRERRRKSPLPSRRTCHGGRGGQDHCYPGRPARARQHCREGAVIETACRSRPQSHKGTEAVNGRAGEAVEQQK